MAAIIGAVAAYSGKKSMWLDEWLTYVAVQHDSLGELFSSYRSGVNAAPPLYFVVVYGVTKVFGLSALTIRLFSAICVAASLPLMWVVLRARCGSWASAFALLACVCTSKVVLLQTLEARFYGFYIFSAALFVCLVDVYNISEKPGKRTALLPFIGSAIFCWSFYLGLPYCASVLAALVLNDILRRRPRPMLYVAIGSGMMSLTVFLPVLLKQVGHPGWIGRPGVTAIFTSGDTGINFHFVLFALAVIAVPWLATVSSTMPAVDKSCKQWRGADIQLLWIAVAFVLSPIGIAIYSLWFSSFMVDRYLVVSNLGYAILLSCFFEKFRSLKWFPDDERTSTRWGQRFCGMAAIGTLLLLAVHPFSFTANIYRNLPRETPGYSKFQTERLPVACSGPFSYFSQYMIGAGVAERFLIVRTESEAAMWAQFNKRIQVKTTDQFLKENDRFYVVSEQLDESFMVVEFMAQRKVLESLFASENAKLWITQDKR